MVLKVTFTKYGDSLLDILCNYIAQELEYENCFKWGLGDADGRALPENKQILKLSPIYQSLMTIK